jgi:hypothetical protein
MTLVSHMPSVYRVALERVRRVLFIHPEFRELPAAVQKRILISHSSLGLALTVARAETRSGIEQVQEGLGFLVSAS